MKQPAGKSVFLEAAERPIPLSFLMLEYLNVRRHELEKEESERTLGEVVEEACRVCGFEDITKEKILYLVTRMSRSSEERKKGGGAKALLRANRDFGGALAEWISGLEPAEVCLWLSSGDLLQANYLYSSADVEEVAALVDVMIQYAFQQAKVRYEAALFGFGGGYKRTPKEGTKVYNLEDPSPEEEDAALEALRQMGF